MGLLHLLQGADRHSSGERIHGAVIGIVTNNKDDEGLGRVRVKFPWLSSTDESFWARVATPMAGPNRGIYFLPEVDDEVVVMFEHGDVHSPFIIGALWNGKDLAPANNDDGENNVRVIRSRSGHIVRLNDKKGAETIEVIDASGKNSIVIDTAKNTVTITSAQDIVLSAPDGAIRLDAQTIDAKASGDATLAAKKADVSGADGLKLHGSRVDIN
jgi:uncharacterized protein involved in type VI secretion and phage assembly